MVTSEQRPILLPKEQTRIRKAPAKNQPQSTLEEAHEAMLEAMDSEPATEVEEVEENANTIQTTSLPVDEDIKPIEQDLVVEEPKTTIVPVSSSVVEGDLTSYERLLRLIGLTEEADILVGSSDISNVRRALASYVGDEPRDLRVDRLLRLVLRLLPLGDDDDSKRWK